MNGVYNTFFIGKIKIEALFCIINLINFRKKKKGKFKEELI